MRHVHDCLSHVFFSYGTLPSSLTSPSRVGPPTASSSSARTGSASQLCWPSQRATPAGLRNDHRPGTLRDPANSPNSSARGHMVSTRSPSGVSPSTREGTGESPHRRTAHRCRHVGHPRAGGALRLPHRAPRPGPLSARRSGVRPRPSGDDHAGCMDHRHAPRTDPGGSRPRRPRPLPPPSPPSPRGSVPACAWPSPSSIDQRPSSWTSRRTTWTPMGESTSRALSTTGRGRCS